MQKHFLMVVVESILGWRIPDTLQRVSLVACIAVTAQCFNACYSPDRSIPTKLAQLVSHREENLSSALPFSAASGRFCVGWESSQVLTRAAGPLMTFR